MWVSRSFSRVAWWWCWRLMGRCGCVSTYGRLEASGDGLRKLKRFSPANVNRAQNFVGRWMDDPTSQRRCHASLLSLAHNV